jgi:hypothetical protein
MSEGSVRGDLGALSRRLEAADKAINAVESEAIFSRCEITTHDPIRNWQPQAPSPVAAREVRSHRVARSLSGGCCSYIAVSVADNDLD